CSCKKRYVLSAASSQIDDKLENKLSLFNKLQQIHKKRPCDQVYFLSLTFLSPLFVKQLNTPPYSLSIDFSQKGKKLYSISFTYLSFKFFSITISSFIYFIFFFDVNYTIQLYVSFSF